MSHTGMSHVTHTNESCHTHEWVMTHVRMSHIGMSHVTKEWGPRPVIAWHWRLRICNVTRGNASCHSQWVMSHMGMSHVTWKWVMSHRNEVWGLHSLGIEGWECGNESCPSHWAMSHIWLSHVTHTHTHTHTHQPKQRGHCQQPNTAKGRTDLYRESHSQSPRECGTNDFRARVPINAHTRCHTSRWVMSHT